MSTPPPVPQQSLTYATPGYMAAYQWEGKQLITPLVAMLPPMCVKCAAAGTVHKTKKLIWVPQWVVLMILVNIIVLLVLYFVLRKQGTVSYSLCERHESARKRNVLLAWLLGLSSIGGLVLMGAAEGIMGRNQAGPLILLGVALFFGLLIACVVFAQKVSPVKPKRITKEFMKLTGFGDAFRERAIFDENAQPPTHGFPIQPVR